MQQIIEKEIDAFLTGNNRNAWLSMGPMRLYVRKGKHLMQYKDGRICLERPCAEATFDVANIEVEEQERGKGWLTMLLDVLEAGKHKVYVEQILEERLFTFLAKRGYSGVNLQSMYKDCSINDRNYM